MLIAISGTILGFLIGLLVGIARTIELGSRAPVWKRALVKLLNAVLGIYIEVFRGTPMMVQAMVIFYGIPYMGGPQLPTLQAAILIISITPARTWPRSCAAASSPSTAGRPRRRAPSA